MAKAFASSKFLRACRRPGDQLEWVMSILSGFVFSETFINYLNGFNIHPQSSAAVFSETALCHRYVFADENGQRHVFQIYEVHDELRFLQLSGKKSFRVIEEALASDSNNGVLSDESYIFQGLLTKSILEGIQAKDDSLRLYFEIRKKSPIVAGILRLKGSQNFRGPQWAALRRFRWNEQEIRLISLGPDCFDLLLLP